MNKHVFYFKPKISLFSRYERVVDRRSYKERREPFLKKKPDEYKPKGLPAVAPKGFSVAKLESCFKNNILFYVLNSILITF